MSRPSKSSFGEGPYSFSAKCCETVGDHSRALLAFLVAATPESVA